MEQQLGVFCQKVSELRVLDQQAIAALATEASEFVAYADAIIDEVEAALRTASKESRMALWYLSDKLCKESEAFTAALKPRILKLAKDCAPKSTDPSWSLFEPLLKSFSFHFEGYLVALIEKELRVGTTASGSGGATGGAAASGGMKGGRTETAIIAQSHHTRSLGAGFVQQRSSNKREGEKKFQLQVKTRDSLMALRVGGTFAPALPEEVIVPQRKADTDAPQGYMQALPANHVEDYVDKRRKRLREVMEANRQQRDAEAEEKAMVKKTLASRFAEAAVNDVVMPLELPRDEFGVKVGNFPDGVRFIRDAIRECGGALELEVIVQRIATLQEKEAVKEFGNVRSFLHIHSPTFTVENEHGKWIVRLTGEEQPQPELREGQEMFSWEEMECPGCSRLLKGRNLAKHKNSRRCVGMQLDRGANRGICNTPISTLAYAARVVLEKMRPSEGGNSENSVAEEEWDDDDLFWLAECIDAAGEEKKFKLAAPHHFTPVLNTIRAVRDKFLFLKKETEMSEVTISWEDRAFVAFFAALGRNIRRLPIAWLETGDVIDMCRRFTTEVRAPFPPPPKAGDPRIRIHNRYPALLFAESDEDNDDEVSGDDGMYSDDEAPAFTFAPPVSISETMMIAGRTRDTKKLNYRLRTAPPMQLTKVLHQEKGSMQEVFSSLQSGVKTRPRPQPQQDASDAAPAATTF